MQRMYNLSTIQSAVSADSQLLDAIEDGFAAFSAGSVHVAPVVHLGFKDAAGAALGDTCVKTGFVKAAENFVVKIASGRAGNAALGLSTSSGVMLVFSQRTGKLEAVLHDEGWLTDLRTAAAGAVVARLFAPLDADKLGIVGTGVQARLQLELLLTVLTECREVVLCGRSQAKLDLMASDCAALLPAITKLRTTTLSSELVGCAVVVTATSATTPVLHSSDVAPGTLVIAVGADGLGKQELDPAILGAAELVVVDSIAQCAAFGDASHAIASGVVGAEALVELGAAINETRAAGSDAPPPPRLARAGGSRSVVADLTGVAVQDVVIATIALAKIRGAC